MCNSVAFSGADCSVVTPVGDACGPLGMVRTRDASESAVPCCDSVRGDFDALIAGGPICFAPRVQLRGGSDGRRQLLLW